MIAAAWPFAIVLGLGTLAAVVAIKRVRRVRRIGHCPLNANTVVVEIGESLWTGQCLDVVSCSEFSPRTAVRCDKRCLRDGFR
jgi:hypothetical protein